MKRRISETQERHDGRYVKTKRHTIEVDGIPYMDEIAAEFGARPLLTDLAMRDWPLFWQCVFGPCLPYHFRLNGPNVWSGARSAIFDLQRRVLYPLNTRLPRDQNLGTVGTCRRALQATVRNVVASFLIMALLLFMSIPI